MPPPVATPRRLRRLLRLLALASALGFALATTVSGFGLKPTWPTSLPLLMIPLDHCLLSPGLRVTSFEVGPRVGSDHLPVLVEIAPLQARLGETIARLNGPDAERESWLAPR